MNRLRTAVGLAAALALSAKAASAKSVTIPKGTYLELKSASSLDSDHAKKADTFTATTTRGLWVDGQLAIPAGCTVTVQVKSVRSPRDGAKSGALGVKFETLNVGGHNYDIEGVLVSLKADERKKILESQGKISTGRQVDVILIGGGTEADMKADTLVGTSGGDRDDLADEWAKSGLGPSTVFVRPGTGMTMQFDKAVEVSGTSGARAVGDRSIYTDPETLKAVERALKGRNYYAGEVTGTLHQPTRDALARFQLDQGQPATGDADEATVQAL
ncbi:MAG TPA: peptidoglycan-binding domain-containing protein, partial [Vicinamibacteria bacterium]|nr:peptidoglycan-binding domain-containing protein [Vicinamibacteria bacterium]